MADNNSSTSEFTPYVPANKTMKELTFKVALPRSAACNDSWLC